MKHRVSIAQSLRVAGVSAAVLVGVAVLVLVGWITGNRRLVQVSPDWTPIVPMTAVTFLISGASLLSITRAMRLDSGPLADRWRRLGRGLALLVALIGGRRLLYYAFDLETSLDMLGFTPFVGPGQMALLTSLAFLLAGSALLLSASPRFRPSSQWLAAIVTILGLLSTTRYLYGGDLTSSFYLVAVHTAVLLGVLGLGIFFVRPDAGFMRLWNGDSTGSVLVRRLFPTALVMPVLVGYLRLLGQRSELYGLETGLALFAIANVGIFAALTWHTAGMLDGEDSARREAERTLRAEKRFSDALVDSLPGVFYLYDRDLNFLRWNRNFETVSGYGSTEIARMRPADFISPTDHARLEERVTEVFEREHSDLEANFRSKDGRLTPYYFTGLRVSLGDRPCLAGVGIDITVRRRAEDQVRELNAELEERVAQRTRELEAKNRELETFTYSVSHDLKAPLRGIDGYSRLLLEDHSERLDEEGRHFLTCVRQASVHMGQLIDDLLAYSQLERWGLQLSHTPLEPLVQGLVAPYAGELAARNISLRAEIPDVEVWTDPAGLQQAIRNLLDNAIKFTAQRERPTIEIGARLDGTRCLLWVQDDGVGFDMKFANRIFDIFQRLHRAEEYPGTGVGLAIVRKAMERLGGRAWAESSPGEGARFWLEIPTTS